MIEIISHRHSSDWAYPKTHEIDEEKIWGFEIHLRSKNSWHVVVKPKEGYSYDLGHWVYMRQVAELINNPKARILKFLNYHSINCFTEDMERLFSFASKLKTTQDKHRKRIP